VGAMLSLNRTHTRPSPAEPVHTDRYSGSAVRYNDKSYGTTAFAACYYYYATQNKIPPPPKRYGQSINSAARALIALAAI